MGINLQKVQIRREKRILRVRKTLRGTTAKPRLCVNKTNKHIRVQLIDDEKGVTLASTATYSKEFKETQYNKRNKASAEKLGAAIAHAAKQQQVTHVVFDRGPHKYHGILAALADGARAAGLQF